MIIDYFLLAGGNSPIDASCTNTANIGTTNIGGIGGVRGSMGYNGGGSHNRTVLIKRQHVKLLAETLLFRKGIGFDNIQGR